MIPSTLIAYAFPFETVPVSSFVLRVHHVYVKQFFLFSFFVSVGRQFFGDAILCNAVEATVPYEIVRETCFINGTFTENSETGEIRHYPYHQWVSLYLLFLAFLFHAPYHLFSCFLLARSVVVPFVRSAADEPRCVLETVEAILDPSTHRRAFAKTVAAELFYLLAVVPSACVLTDRFLCGRLLEEGALVFPLDTKCDVTYFAGGSETRARFHCMLPANVFHRLVFETAKAGAVAVLALHALSLLHKACVFRFPSLRGGEEDVDVWWTFAIAEGNTQGENAWRLRRAFLERRRSSTRCSWKPSKAAETRLDLLA